MTQNEHAISPLRQRMLDDHLEPPFSGLIDVFVNEVGALARRLEGRVPFEWGPETQEYGLRELGIKDVNGDYLVFARDECVERRSAENRLKRCVCMRIEKPEAGCLGLPG